MVSASAIFATLTFDSDFLFDVFSHLNHLQSAGPHSLDEGKVCLRLQSVARRAQSRFLSFAPQRLKPFKDLEEPQQEVKTSAAKSEVT